MGGPSWDLLHGPCLHTVPATDLHYLHAQEGGQFEYSDDVHSDPWELRLGGKLVSTAGNGRLERVGGLRRYWLFARLSPRHGHIL